MGAPDLERVFSGLRQKSQKVDSYFRVYQSLFEGYRDVPDLVFVEVGVMNGGSLVMWREFFGPGARIIGIDYSRTAERMREKGFEIFIGDQGSPAFWERFYAEVGPVHVLLDDGGHSNKHQIVTVESSLGHIRDGGLIVVEDTGTSYLRDWGNPSRYSFMNYAKRAADRIQARSALSPYAMNRFSSAVHSVGFYESMVAFHVDRRLCRKASDVRVGTEEIAAVNVWNADKQLVRSQSGRTAVRAFLRRLGIEGPVRGAYLKVNAVVARLRFVVENWGLRKYF